MADSMTTKRRLAESFKKLLLTDSFEKISVGDICDNCKMNRKSFYYHFRDKYDLVTWIFDNDFYIPNFGDTDAKQPEEVLMLLCDYLYKNRSYYKKIMPIKGHNSFAEHFFDAVKSKLAEYVRASSLPYDEYETSIPIIASMFVALIYIWLTRSDSRSAEEFVRDALKIFPLGTSIQKEIFHL